MDNPEFYYAIIEPISGNIMGRAYKAIDGMYGFQPNPNHALYSEELLLDMAKILIELNNTDG